jgi:hypothetical protein
MLARRLGGRTLGLFTSAIPVSSRSARRSPSAYVAAACSTAREWLARFLAAPGSLGVAERSGGTRGLDRFETAHRRALALLEE